MKRITFVLTATIALLLTTGCAPATPKYRVTIDAITAPNTVVAPSSYSIKALKKETDPNSLKFQYHAQKLKTILNTQGYNEVDSYSAKQVIYFDYGIEKVQELTQTYSEPDISIGMSWGYPYHYRGRHYHPFWNNYGYGGTYTTYSKTYTYYNRFITLLAKTPAGKELWRVDLSSVGESQNLKKIVPLLLDAAIPYIGKNTEEPVKIVVKEKKAKKE